MHKVVPIPYPQPIPFPRLHRCAHPVRHSLLVVGLLAGWLWWSWQTKGLWGVTLAAWLDPQRRGFGLPIAVLTELAWYGVVPVVALALYLLGMWHCTGARPSPAVQQVLAAAFQEPAPPHPVLIERVCLTAEEAARRGLSSPVIVERIHYR